MGCWDPTSSHGFLFLLFLLLKMLLWCVLASNEIVVHFFGGGQDGRGFLGFKNFD